jgi:hypothetical protein
MFTPVWLERSPRWREGLGRGAIGSTGIDRLVAARKNP